MPNRQPRLIAAALLAAATVLAFAPVVWNDFVNFDDPLYVTKNPIVQRGLTLDNVGWALTSTAAVYWHPLTWLSHMLDWQLFGAAASGHHLTSLLIHTTNTVVLLLVLESATGALWPSAIVAALFGVHPLHVESVAWVAERKDVLSTLFLFLGMGAYVAWVRRGGATRYAAVVASFVLGLMAKPMLVTFPFLLLLLDYWPLARRTRPLALIVEKLPLVAVALADTAFSLVEGRKAGAVRSLSGVPFPSRLANAALASVGYLRKTLWPVDLACFYPYPSTFDPWLVAGAVVTLAAISVLAIGAARRAPFVLVGWLWYLGTLAPVIGLVQVGHQSMADRYTYVPLIGIFLAAVFAAAAAVERWRPSPRLVAAPVLIVLGLCMLLTRVQATQWRTSTTLFTHALAVTTDNYMAHEKLGEALASDGRRQEAIAQLRETVRLTPTFAEAHVALADALLEEHDDAGALAHYAEALRLKPEDATAHAKLGSALWHAGNAAEARTQFEEAVRLAPGDAESLSNLGAVLLGLGRREEALTRLDAAVRLDPSNAAAHGNLGFALAASGRFDEAERQLEQAIALDPGLAGARFNLGNVLFTRDRVADAAQQFERALAIDPDYAEAHNNLGVALERLGRPAEARPHFAEALRLRPDYGAAADNLARLERGG